VPQAPQNAKPTWTLRPQFGQAISPAGPPVGLSGAGVVDGWIPAPVERGAAPGPASGLGGSWKGTGAGILGESFQGIPPLGLAAPAEFLSSPALTVAAIAAGIPPSGAGGNTVRAVSSGPSLPTPALGEGAGAGRASSFPQPRQNL